MLPLFIQEKENKLIYPYDNETIKILFLPHPIQFHLLVLQVIIHLLSFYNLIYLP